MTARVRHAKTSTLPDSNDPNLVNASDWNEDHTIEGIVEEAPVDGKTYARKDGAWELVGSGTTTWARASVASGVIDVSAAGDVPRVPLTENVTSMTFPTLPPAGTVKSLLIIFAQDSTGGRSVAGWPSGVVWATGSAPSISTTAGAITAISFLIHSDGLILGGM